MQKFQVGDYARIGGPTGRMPGDYPWLRKGRLVKIAEVIINQRNLGSLAPYNPMRQVNAICQEDEALVFSSRNPDMLECKNLEELR